MKKNRFGVDWRDPTTYPNIEREDAAVRLRWEFMRRNPQYEVDRARWRDAIQESRVGQVQVECTAEDLADPIRLQALRKKYSEAQAAAASLLSGLQRELCDRWGIEQSTKPWPISSSRTGFRDVRFSALQLPSIPPLCLSDEPVDLAETTLRTNTTQLWIRFDLASRIKLQLIRAKAMLEDAKREMEQRVELDGLLQEFGLMSLPAPNQSPPKSPAADKKTKKARNPEILIRGLRTLDAVEGGCKQAEIAAVLHPDVTNEYPVLAGNRRVREDLVEATAMVNFGFLQLHVVKEGKEANA